VVRIAPSILSADFARLGDAVNAIEPEADLLHVDVMDGHFVPNLTIGPPVVASLDAVTDLFLDCHLMMTDPADFLEPFRDAGADGCSVHVEVGNTATLIAQMRDLGLATGLVANPDTPFDVFAPFLADVDLMLLMTVFPGFAGQSFITEVMPKVAETRRELDRLESPAALQVDGGIGPDTIGIAAAAGADTFVAGSAIFGAPDPQRAARSLRASALSTLGAA
jgi:ribulose-phosphate 3-epimerase